MATETPAQLWRSAAATDPARPFVTAYDSDTGGRVELSYATVDNWVAKTANMLVDGLGAEPGDRVALALPVHWQSLAWALACWSAGATVVLPQADEVPEADIAVTDASRIEAGLDSGAREVVGTSLHPLGAPLDDCPPAALDYTVEVRGYADQFVPTTAGDPAAVALESAGNHTGGELAAAARDRAASWELTPADRVAIITPASAPFHTLGHDLSPVLCPVVTGASLLLTPETESLTTLQSRLDMERVTAIAGARPEFPALTGNIRPLP